MTREEVVSFSLALPGVYEDWPFDDVWFAVRHRGNKKTCLFMREMNGKIILNLKCDPMQADFWRQIYAGVVPGYHMNKVHWNTVTLGSDVPDDELQNMIRHSHALTAPKKRKSKKA